MAVMLSVMMIILTTEFVHCAVGCTSAGATKKASLGESHTYHFCLCQLKQGGKSGKPGLQRAFFACTARFLRILIVHR